MKRLATLANVVVSLLLVSSWLSPAEAADPIKVPGGKVRYGIEMREISQDSANSLVTQGYVDLWTYAYFNKAGFSSYIQFGADGKTLTLFNVQLNTGGNTHSYAIYKDETYQNATGTTGYDNSGTIAIFAGDGSMSSCNGGYGDEPTPRYWANADFIDNVCPTYAYSASVAYRPYDGTQSVDIVNMEGEDWFRVKMYPIRYRYLQAKSFFTGFYSGPSAYSGTGIATKTSNGSSTFIFSDDKLNVLVWPNYTVANSAGNYSWTFGAGKQYGNQPSSGIDPDVMGFVMGGIKIKAGVTARLEDRKLCPDDDLNTILTLYLPAGADPDNDYDPSTYTVEVKYEDNSSATLSSSPSPYTFGPRQRNDDDSVKMSFRLPAAYLTNASGKKAVSVCVTIPQKNPAEDPFTACGAVRYWQYQKLTTGITRNTKTYFGTAKGVYPRIKGKNGAIDTLEIRDLTDIAGRVVVNYDPSHTAAPWNKMHQDSTYLSGQYPTYLITPDDFASTELLYSATYNGTYLPQGVNLSGAGSVGWCSNHNVVWEGHYCLRVTMDASQGGCVYYTDTVYVRLTLYLPAPELNVTLPNCSGSFSVEASNSEGYEADLWEWVVRWEGADWCDQLGNDGIFSSMMTLYGNERDPMQSYSSSNSDAAAFYIKREKTASGTTTMKAGSQTVMDGTDTKVYSCNWMLRFLDGTSVRSVISISGTKVSVNGAAAKSEALRTDIPIWPSDFSDQTMINPDLQHAPNGDRYAWKFDRGPGKKHYYARYTYQGQTSDWGCVYVPEDWDAAETYFDQMKTTRAGQYQGFGISAASGIEDKSVSNTFSCSSGQTDTGVYLGTEMTFKLYVTNAALFNSLMSGATFSDGTPAFQEIAQNPGILIHWQYSTNGGTSWSTWATTSNAKAQRIACDDNVTYKTGAGYPSLPRLLYIESPERIIRQPELHRVGLQPIDLVNGTVGCITYTTDPYNKSSTTVVVGNKGTIPGMNEGSETGGGASLGLYDRSAQVDIVSQEGKIIGDSIICYDEVKGYVFPQLTVIGFTDPDDIEWIVKSQKTTGSAYYNTNKTGAIFKDYVIPVLGGNNNLRPTNMTDLRTGVTYTFGAVSKSLDTCWFNVKAYQAKRDYITDLVINVADQYDDVAGYCFGVLDGKLSVKAKEGAGSSDLPKGPLAPSDRGYTNWGIQKGIGETEATIAWGTIDTTSGPKTYNSLPAGKHWFRPVYTNMGCVGYGDPVKVRVNPKVVTGDIVSDQGNVVCDGTEVKLFTSGSQHVGTFQWTLPKKNNSSLYVPSAEKFTGDTVKCTFRLSNLVLTDTSWIDSVIVYGKMLFGESSSKPNTCYGDSVAATIISEICSPAGPEVVVDTICKNATATLTWGDEFKTGDKLLYSTNNGATWKQLVEGTGKDFTQSYVSATNTTTFTLSGKSATDTVVTQPFAPGGPAPYRFRIVIAAAPAGNDSTDISNKSLVVKPIPTFKAQMRISPKDTLCMGETIGRQVEISDASAPAVSTLKYDWHINGTYTNNGWNAGPGDRTVRKSDSGRYRVVITNYVDAAGCMADTVVVDTAIVVLSTPKVPAMGFNPASVKLCVESDSGITINNPAPVLDPTAVKYEYTWYVFSAVQTPFDAAAIADGNSARKQKITTGTTPRVPISGSALSTSTAEISSNVSAGTYYIYVSVKAYNARNCDTIVCIPNYVTLEIAAKPELTADFSGVETSYCENQKVVLTPNITSSVPSPWQDYVKKVEWFKTDETGTPLATIASFSASTTMADLAYTINKAAQSDAGKYIIKFTFQTDVCENTATADITIEVKATPKLSWDDFADTYCEGKTVKLQAKNGNSNATGLTWKWQWKDGATYKDITGPTTATYSFAAQSKTVKYDDSLTTYRAIAFADNCADTTSDTLITIHFKPTAPSFDMKNDTDFCRDQLLLLPYKVANTGGGYANSPSYAWYYGNSKPATNAAIWAQSVYPTYDYSKASDNGFEDGSGNMRLRSQSYPTSTTGYLTVDATANLQWEIIVTMVSTDYCRDTNFHAMQAKPIACNPPTFKGDGQCPSETDTREMVFTDGYPASTSVVLMQRPSRTGTPVAVDASKYTRTPATGLAADKTVKFKINMSERPAAGDTNYYCVEVTRSTGTIILDTFYIVYDTPDLKTVTVTMVDPTSICGGNPLALTADIDAASDPGSTRTYEWTFTKTSGTTTAPSPLKPVLGEDTTFDTKTTDDYTGTYKLEVTSRTKDHGCEVKRSGTSGTITVKPLPTSVVKLSAEEVCNGEENVEIEAEITYSTAATPASASGITVAWFRRQGTADFAPVPSTVATPGAVTLSGNVAKAKLSFAGGIDIASDSGEYKLVVTSLLNDCTTQDSGSLRPVFHAAPKAKSISMKDTAVCNLASGKFLSATFTQGDADGGATVTLEGKWEARQAPAVFNKYPPTASGLFSAVTSPATREWNTTNRITHSDSGTYRFILQSSVEIGAGKKCYAYDTVTAVLTVNPLPTGVKIDTIDRPVWCEGEKDTVKVKVHYPTNKGDYTYTYSWGSKGAPTAVTKGDSEYDSIIMLAVPATDLALGSDTKKLLTYTLEVSATDKGTKCDSLFTATKHVEVVGKPKAQTAVVDAVACEGDKEVVLKGVIEQHASATGFTGEWYKYTSATTWVKLADVPLVENTDYTATQTSGTKDTVILTFKKAIAQSDAAKYKFLFTSTSDHCQALDSVEPELKVNPIPYFSEAKVYDTFACEGTSGMKVRATYKEYAGASVSGKWERRQSGSWVDLSKTFSTSPDYYSFTSDLQRSDSGLYRVALVATYTANNLSCYAYDTAEGSLRVDTLPAKPKILAQGGSSPIELCLESTGNKFVDTVDVSGNPASGFTYKYTWKETEHAVSTAEADLPAATDGKSLVEYANLDWYTTDAGHKDKTYTFTLTVSVKATATGCKNENSGTQQIKVVKCEEATGDTVEVCPKDDPETFNITCDNKTVFGKWYKTASYTYPDSDPATHSDTATHSLWTLEDGTNFKMDSTLNVNTFTFTPKHNGNAPDANPTDGGGAGKGTVTYYKTTATLNGHTKWIVCKYVVYPVVGIRSPGLVSDRGSATPANAYCAGDEFTVTPSMTLYTESSSAELTWSWFPYFNGSIPSVPASQTRKTTDATDKLIVGVNTLTAFEDEWDFTATDSIKGIFEVKMVAVSKEGCVDSLRVKTDTMRIYVTPSATVNADDVAICEGLDTAFKVKSLTAWRGVATDTSYEWFKTGKTAEATARGSELRLPLSGASDVQYANNGDTYKVYVSSKATYTVKTANDFTCTNRDSAEVQLTVYPKPKISDKKLAIGTDNICEEDPTKGTELTASFNVTYEDGATGAGGGTKAYAWYKPAAPNTLSASAPDRTFSTDNDKYTIATGKTLFADSGQYEVVLAYEDNKGCLADTDTVRNVLHIFRKAKAPVVVATPENPQALTVCVGSTDTMWMAVQNAPEFPSIKFNYIWQTASSATATSWSDLSLSGRTDRTNTSDSLVFAPTTGSYDVSTDGASASDIYYRVVVEAVTANGCKAYDTTTVDAVKGKGVLGKVTNCEPPKLDPVNICPGDTIKEMIFTYHSPLPPKSIDWYVSTDTTQTDGGWKDPDAGYKSECKLSDMTTDGGTCKFFPAEADMPAPGDTLFIKVVLDKGLGSERTAIGVYHKYKEVASITVADMLANDVAVPGPNKEKTYCEGTELNLEADIDTTTGTTYADIQKITFDWHRIFKNASDVMTTDHAARKDNDATYRVSASLNRPADSGIYRVMAFATSKDGCLGDTVYDSIRIRVDLKPTVSLALVPDPVEICWNKPVSGQLTATVTNGSIKAKERTVLASGATPTAADWATWADNGLVAGTAYSFVENDVVRMVEANKRKHDTVNHYRVTVGSELGVCPDDKDSVIVTVKALTELAGGTVTSDETPDTKMDACAHLKLTVHPKKDDHTTDYNASTPKYQWQWYDFGNKVWKDVPAQIVSGKNVNPTSATLGEIPAVNDYDTAAYRCRLIAQEGCPDTVYSDSVQVHVYKSPVAGTLVMDTTQPICYMPAPFAAFTPTDTVKGFTGKVVRWEIFNDFSPKPDTVKIVVAAPKKEDSTYTWDWNTAYEGGKKLSDLVARTDNVRRTRLTVRAFVNNDGGCDEVPTNTVDIWVYNQIPTAKANRQVSDTICTLSSGTEEFIAALGNGSSLNTSYESYIWEVTDTLSKFTTDGARLDTVRSGSTKISGYNTMGGNASLSGAKLDLNSGLRPTYYNDTTFYVRITASNWYCPDTPSKVNQVTVIREARAVNATLDTAICEGDSVILYAKRPAASPLVWYKGTDRTGTPVSGAGLNADGYDTLKIAASELTFDGDGPVYQFRAYDSVNAAKCASNWSTPGTFKITVREKPAADSIGVNDNRQICGDGTSALTATAYKYKPTTGAKFEWQLCTDTSDLDNAMYSGYPKKDQGASLPATNPKPDSTLWYYVRYIVSGECGSDTSAWDSVRVFIAPKFETEPFLVSGATICEDSTAKIAFKTKAGYRYEVYKVNAANNNTGGTKVDSGYTRLVGDTVTIKDTLTYWYYVVLTDTLNTSGCGITRSDKTKTVKVEVERMPVAGLLTINEATGDKKEYRVDLGQAANFTLTGTQNAVKADMQATTKDNGETEIGKNDTVYKLANVTVVSATQVNIPQVNFKQRDMDTVFTWIKVSGKVCPPAYSDTVKIAVDNSDKPRLEIEKDPICVTGDTATIVVIVPLKEGFDWNDIKLERKLKSEPATAYIDVTNKVTPKIAYDATATPPVYDTVVKDTSIHVGGTYEYRFISQLSATKPDTSHSVTIRIDSVSRAGRLLVQDNPICQTQPDTMTLVDNFGSLLAFEYVRKDTVKNAWTSDADYKTKMPLSGPAGYDTLFYVTATGSTADSGWYRVVVQNGACPADTSDPLLVQIIPSPKAGELVVNDTFCYGQPMNPAATMTLKGNSDTVIRWFVDTSADRSQKWLYAGGKFDDSTHFDTVGPFYDKVYVVAEVSDPYGVCASERTAPKFFPVFDTVKIDDITPDTAYAFRNSTDAVDFTVTASTGGLAYTGGGSFVENAPGSYQWQRFDTATKKWVDITSADADFSGYTTDKLTVDKACPDHEGEWFRAIVRGERDRCGDSVISDSVTIAGWDVLDPGYTYSLTRGTCYYPGDSAFYYVTGASGEGPLHYTWYLRKGTDAGNPWHKIPDVAYNPADTLPDAISFIAGHFILRSPDTNFITFDNIDTLMKEGYITIMAKVTDSKHTNPDEVEAGDTALVEICLYPKPKYVFDSAVLCSLARPKLLDTTFSVDLWFPADLPEDEKKIDSGYDFRFEYTYAFAGGRTFDNYRDTIKLADHRTIDSADIRDFRVYADTNWVKLPLADSADNLWVRVDVYTNFKVGIDTTLYGFLRVDMPLEKVRTPDDLVVCTDSLFSFDIDFKRGQPGFKTGIEAGWYYAPADPDADLVGTLITNDTTSDDQVNYNLAYTVDHAKYNPDDSVYIFMAWTDVCKLYPGDTIFDTVRVRVVDQPQLKDIALSYNNNDTCANSSEYIVLTATVDTLDHPSDFRLEWWFTQTPSDEASWTKIDTTGITDSIALGANADGVASAELTLKKRGTDMAGTYKVVLTVDEPCAFDTALQTDVILYVMPDSVWLDPGTKVSMMKGAQRAVSVKWNTVDDMGYNTDYIFLDEPFTFEWFFKDGAGFTSLGDAALNDLKDTLIVGDIDKQTLTFFGVLDYNDTSFRAEITGSHHCGTVPSNIDTLNVIDKLQITDAKTMDTVFCSNDTEAVWEISVTTTAIKAKGYKWEYVSGTDVTEVTLPDNDLTAPHYWDTVTESVSDGNTYVLRIANPTGDMDGYKYRFTVWDSLDRDSTYAEARNLYDFTLHVSKPFKFTCADDEVLQKNANVVFNNGTPCTVNFTYQNCDTQIMADKHLDSIIYKYELMADTANSHYDSVQSGKNYSFTACDSAKAVGYYFVRFSGHNMCAADTVYDTVRVIRKVEPDSIRGQEKTPPTPKPFSNDSVDWVKHEYGPKIDTLDVWVCEDNIAKLIAPFKGGPADTSYWQIAVPTATDTAWEDLAMTSPYSRNAVGDTLTINPATLDLNGNYYRLVHLMPDGLPTVYSGVFRLWINSLPDMSHYGVGIWDAEEDASNYDNDGQVPTDRTLLNGDARNDKLINLYVSDTSWEITAIPGENPGEFLYDTIVRFKRIMSDVLKRDFDSIQFYRISPDRTDTSMVASQTSSAANFGFVSFRKVTLDVDDTSKFFIKCFSECGYTLIQPELLRIYDSLKIRWIPDTVMEHPGDKPWDSIVQTLDKTLEPGDLLVLTNPDSSQNVAYVVLCDQQEGSMSDTAEKGFIVSPFMSNNPDKTAHFIYEYPSRPGVFRRVARGGDIVNGQGATATGVYQNDKGDLIVIPTMALNGLRIWGVGANNVLRDTTVLLNLIVVPNILPGSLHLEPSHGEFCYDCDSNYSVKLSSDDYNDSRLLQYMDVNGGTLHFDWYEKRPGDATWRNITDSVSGLTYKIGYRKYPEDSLVQIRVVGQSRCGSDVTFADLVLRPSIRPGVRLIPEDTAACQGEPITFTAIDSLPGKNPVFSWYVNDSLQEGQTGKTLALNNMPVGTHRIVVRMEADHSIQCLVDTVVYDTAVFIVRAELEPGAMKITPTDTTFCSEGEGEFTVSGVDGYPVIWHIGKVVPVLGNDEVLYDTVPVHDSLLSNAGMTMRTGKLPLEDDLPLKGDIRYYIRAIATADCGSDTVVAEVLIRKPGKPAVRVFEPDSICFGDTPPTFYATDSNAGENPLYTWYLNGTEVEGVTGSTYTPDAADITAVGDYTVEVKLTVTDPKLCVVPDTAVDQTYFTVLPLPVAVVKVDTTPILNNETTFVHVESGDGEPFVSVRWLQDWQVKDPDKDTTETVLLDYREDVYWFTAVVKNKYGCRDTARDSLRVLSNFTLDSLKADVYVPPVLPIDDESYPGYPEDPYDVYNPYHGTLFPPRFVWRSDTVGVLYICPHNTAMFVPQTTGGQNPWAFSWTIEDGNATMAWPRKSANPNNAGFRVGDWKWIGFELDTTVNPEDTVFGIFFPDSTTHHITLSAKDNSNGSEVTMHIEVRYYHPEYFYLEAQPKVTHSVYYEGQAVNLQAKPDRNWWITWIKTYRDEVIDTVSTYSTSRQDWFTARESHSTYTPDETGIWITAIDRYGCRIWDSIAVRVIPKPNVLLLDDPDHDVIFPEFEVEITNAWGRCVKSFDQRNANGDSKGWDGKTPSGEKVKAGTYYYRTKVPTLITDDDKSGFFIMTGAVTVLENVTRYNKR